MIESIKLEQVYTMILRGRKPVMVVEDSIIEAYRIDTTRRYSHIELAFFYLILGKNEMEAMERPYQEIIRIIKEKSEELGMICIHDEMNKYFKFTLIDQSILKRPVFSIELVPVEDAIFVLKSIFKSMCTKGYIDSDNFRIVQSSLHRYYHYNDSQQTWNDLQLIVEGLNDADLNNEFGNDGWVKSLGITQYLVYQNN